MSTITSAQRRGTARCSPRTQALKQLLPQLQLQDHPGHHRSNVARRRHNLSLSNHTRATVDTWMCPFLWAGKNVVRQMVVHTSSIIIRAPQHGKTRADPRFLPLLPPVPVPSPATEAPLTPQPKLSRPHARHLVHCLVVGRCV